MNEIIGNIMAFLFIILIIFTILAIAVLPEIIILPIYPDVEYKPPNYDWLFWYVGIGWLIVIPSMIISKIKK